MYVYCLQIAYNLQMLSNVQTTNIKNLKAISMDIGHL